MLLGNRVLIRPTGADEMAALLEVYRACEDFLALGPVAVASTEMVLIDLEISRKEGGLFCGIYRLDSGKMIGVVDFVREGWEGNPNCAFLALLMIAAPERSHGIGAEVVRLVEEELFRSGQVDHIASGVQVNNPGGIRFWRAMGFEIVSEAEQMADGTVAFKLLKKNPTGMKSIVDF
jgi:ribosomal protein S18 acetylase RimI-like enzyme